MRGFVKRIAVVLAVGAVFACGGWTDAENTSITASAADEYAYAQSIDEHLSAIVTDSTVELKWQKQYGISAYEIFKKDRDGSLSFVKYSASEHTIVDELDANTEYTFVIKGYSGSESVTIGSVEAKTRKKKTLLLSASPIESMTVSDFDISESTDEVTFSFGELDGIEKYNIYQKQQDGTYKPVAQTDSDIVTLKGLKPETEYYFAVRGQAGESFTQYSYAAVRTLIPADSIKLKEVKGLKVSGVEDKSVTLSWLNQNGVDHHNVYLQQTDGSYKYLGGTTRSSYTVTGLRQETSYNFGVSGALNGEFTPISSVSTKTLNSNSILLKKVKGIKSDATDKTVTISWQLQDGVHHHNVYLKQADGSYKYLGGTTRSSYTVTGLKQETNYTFGVRGALNGEYTPLSSVSVKTYNSNSAVLKKVLNLKAENVDDISVTLSWQLQDGLQYHNVYLRQADGSYKYLTGTIKSSYKVTGLKPQTSYVFAVRGAANGEFTPYSTITVKTKTGIVVTGVKANATESTIQLKWTQLAQAQAYYVYLKDSDGKYKYNNSTKQTTLTLSGLKADTGYSFIIKAKLGDRITAPTYVTAKTLRTDVTIKFEGLNQLGGEGNSGKVKATYGCGGTSLTMLLNAKGLNLNKDTVLKKQYANGWCAAFCPLPFPYAAYSWGSVMSNLVDLAKSYGFSPKVNTAPTTDDIKRVLAGNNLVLVGLRTVRGAHHFEVIYGYYVKNGVTYFRVHDPYGNYDVEWTAEFLRQRIYAVNSSDYLCRQVRGILWL